MRNTDAIGSVTEYLQLSQDKASAVCCKEIKTPYSNALSNPTVFYVTFNELPWSPQSSLAVGLSRIHCEKRIQRSAVGGTAPAYIHKTLHQPLRATTPLTACTPTVQSHQKIISHQQTLYRPQQLLFRLQLECPVSRVPLSEIFTLGL
jgi:hypothetical protein